MNSQIEKLISTAEKYLGGKESPPNSNNVIFNTHYYGKEVSGSSVPWCMAFVWDIFRLAGLSHLFYGGDKTASCDTLHTYAKVHGQLVKPNELRRGDVVFYKFGTAKKVTDHTGLITNSSAAGITAIEGNTSVNSDNNGGEVMLRTRPYTNIVGGYRPKYEEDEVFTYEKFKEYAAKYEAEKAAKPKSDAPSVWAEKATGWATEEGLFTGDENGEYHWHDNITREETAVVLRRFFTLMYKLLE